MKPRPVFLCFALTLLACSASDDDAEDGNDTVADDAETAPTTEADSSGGGDDGDLRCAANLPEDANDGATGIMGTWGAACGTDADCVPLLGDGAVCLKKAVIFETPGGYCSRPCDLPMGMSGFIADDPMCAPEGGVSCLGVEGTFEYCAVPCTDNSQCERAGYYCRLMPIISQETDPTFCLMPDCCEEESPGVPGCDM